MQPTKSSVVKDIKVQEDEAVELMKKNIESKKSKNQQTKGSFDQQTPRYSLPQNPVHQYAEEVDVDKLMSSQRDSNLSQRNLQSIMF